MKLYQSATFSWYKEMKIQHSKMPKLKEGISTNTKILKKTHENDYSTSKIPRINDLCFTKKTISNSNMNPINDLALMSHPKLQNCSQIDRKQKVLSERAIKGSLKENINKNYNISFKRKKETNKLHTIKNNHAKIALPTKKIPSHQSLCPKIMDISRRCSIYYSSNPQLSFAYNNGIEPSALAEIDANRPSIIRDRPAEDVFTALEKFDFVKDTPPTRKPTRFLRSESIVNRLSIYNLPQNLRTAATTPSKSEPLYANPTASQSSSALLDHTTPQRQCPKRIVTAPLSISRPPPNSIYRTHNISSISHNSLSALPANNVFSCTTMNRYALKMNGLLSQSYAYKCPQTTSALVSLGPATRSGPEPPVVMSSILKKALPAPEEMMENSLLGFNKVEKKKKIVKWKDDVTLQSPPASIKSGFKHKSPPPQLLEISIPADAGTAADSISNARELDVAPYESNAFNLEKDLTNEGDEKVNFFAENSNAISYDTTRRDGDASPGADILSEKLDVLELSSDDLYTSYFNFSPQKSLQVPSTPASLFDNSLLRAFDPLVSS